MQRIIGWAGWILLAASSILKAQPQCGIEQLRGNWSAVSVGWATMTAPGPWTVGQTLPVAGIAVLAIDQTGKFSGPGSIVVNGLALDYEMTGAVEMSSDCTGVIRYSVKLKGSADVLPGYVERFVLDRNQQQLTSISIQTPISKPTWTTTMRHIANPPSRVAWPDIVP
jgi:hypothetical protein